MIEFSISCLERLQSTLKHSIRMLKRTIDPKLKAFHNAILYRKISLIIKKYREKNIVKSELQVYISMSSD